MFQSSGRPYVMPGFSCSVPGCFQLLSTTLYKEVPPSNVADWIKSKLDCAYFSLIGSSRCQSKREQSLRLGVRWNSLSKEKRGQRKLTSSEFSGKVLYYLWTYSPRETFNTRNQHVTRWRASSIDWKSTK